MSGIGFVFPGQGSQKQGMLLELAHRYSLILETFAAASDVLGLDLWDIAQHNPEDQLNQTAITQPVLLTASVAIMRVWQEAGGARPAIVAGHSLGEYTALVSAEVLDFATAVKLVHERGKFMQSAVKDSDGKMAAIVGLESTRIIEICDEASALGTVSAANLNSPEQTVIAGEHKAVEKAMQLCKDAGAKRALPLNVSVPSHCALMRPAARQLQAVLESVGLHEPTIAVVPNATAEITTETAAIKQNLVKQLDSPVRWVDCVRVMADTGVSHFVECGPGKVLCGLIRRIDPGLNVVTSDTLAAFESALTELSN